MPTQNEKLAAALEELRTLQQDGSRVFASKQLTRTSRERLVKHGFLQVVMKGCEPEPAARAVLGHWLLGYIHPFPDGNGRVARLLMNTLLAAGGYPWTVIRVEARADYLSALETASVDSDVRPFARLVAKHMRRTARNSRQSGERV